MKYFLRPGFDLPALTFTFEQIDALAVGLSFVEAAGDAFLSLAAKEVRAKLQADLPGPDHRKLDQAPYFASKRQGCADPKLRTIVLPTNLTKALKLIFRRSFWRL